MKRRIWTEGAAVLLGRDKFIEFYEDRKEALYDLETDLGETDNLIEKDPEKAAKLRELLHQWQREAGALFPKEN